MILLESNGQAAMTVGPYHLWRSVLCCLLRDVQEFHSEKSSKLNCAPEVLWLVKDGKLIAGVSEERRSIGESQV